MKSFISFGFFNLKYTIIIIVFTLIILYRFIVFIFPFAVLKEVNKIKLLEPLLFYIGYSLCFIPLLIQKAKSKKNMNEKKKLEEESRGFITYIYNNPYQLRYCLYCNYKFIANFSKFLFDI